jgi:DNA-binding SARP family transcriptional activator/predicted negative regulator of RcsB-dependent stress response
VDFRILGPLEITAGAERLGLGGPRQEVVVATLLLSANRLVTIDRLLEAMYGEDLPPTGRSQAQISISTLRRLFALHGSSDIIATHAHGYIMNVECGQLDSQRFEGLVAAGRVDRDAGHRDKAVASYRDALRLWRGPALEGMDSQFIRAAAGRLDEQRIATNEDRIKLELDLGRHHELVGELAELVEEYPLRERLRGLLMLALYRCDRVPEALQVYRQARQTMIDELGIEPSERLQQLEQAILTTDPALDPTAEPITIQPVKQTPFLLPTDIADFTGRTEQIEQIGQHLTQAAAEDARGAVPIVVIVGRGGVGKSTIAVHASHGVADRFPDGQLFADLHGGAAHPTGPAQVLERFLRVLGVPGSQMPDGLEERAEMYRNLLADRRVLVVLDDALSESQVSPLLPGSGPAAVIATSRTRLAGLAGAVHVEVNVFDADKSLELLASIVGIRRVQEQPQAAAAVTKLCGHLPLALRIAGARLSARPHWSIQQLLEHLADETRRLDELQHGDMGVRPSISLTYESASEQARRLFRRLALLELPVFSGWLGAALLDQPLGPTQELLDDLVAAQLIETDRSGAGMHGQYGIHELIRVFARERLAAEEPAAERKAALERALGALLYVAEEAHCRYYGGDYVRLRSEAQRWPLPGSLVGHLVSDPLSWYERERAALVSGVRQAAQAGLVELCWGLALIAITFFESRTYLDDWREINDTALEATRKAHHVRGEAAMLYATASLHMAQQRFEPARRGLAAAAGLFAQVGDDQGIGLVTCHIASIDRVAGQLDDATKGYEQVMAIFRRTGDQMAAAYVLHSLAQVKLELREFDEAMELLSDALRLSRVTQCRRIEAQVLHRMGEAYLRTGELPRAVDAFHLALVRIRDLGDPVGEAYVLWGVGVAKARLGEFDQASSALQRSLDLAGSAGERLAEARALLGLSELALIREDPRRAVALGERASGVFREIGAPLYDTQALTVLSSAHAALGDSDAAKAASEKAIALRAELIGDVEVQSQAILAASGQSTGEAS